MTEQAQAQKVENWVDMVDGSRKNFGVKGRLLSTTEIVENGFDITFHIVTGEQVNFNYRQEAPLPTLLAEMAAFGVASKVKASTAGSEIADLKTVITAKKEEIEEGTFSGRGATAGDDVSPATQLQTAYANVHGLDISNKEGLAKVNAIFAAFSKEEKSALYKIPAIKLEILKLKFAQAQAELEGVE